MKQASTFVFILVVVVNVGLRVRPAICEDLTPVSPSSQPSAHEVLDGLDDALRANAMIDLEISGVVDNATSFQTEHVESLWNQGRHTEALAALEVLERTGIKPAAGIAWTKAIPSRSPEWYPDVAIGGGRTGFEKSAIGHDSVSGNIFVLTRWADGWSMNISTDHGVSFSETYFWAPHALVDMTVVGDRIWVAYAPDTSIGAVRMRRFLVSDGTEDSAYGFNEIDDIAPDEILDLVLESNAPDTNNRIYLAYTDGGSDAGITILFDDLTGTSFSSIPTGIRSAWWGLDLAWNPYPDSPSEGNLWISFIDPTPEVQIYTNTNTFFFFNESTEPFTGTERDTGLSAYEGNVYCVYEKDNGSGQNGVAYLTSSDTGATWWTGDAFVPASGGPSARRPKVTVRSGVKPAVIFNSNDPPVDRAWHTQREAMSSGPWGGPLFFNDHELGLGHPSEIEFLDVFCVRSHGMVYGADDGVPYFDLMTPRCFFGDGFESGNTSEWSMSTR